MFYDVDGTTNFDIEYGFNEKKSIRIQAFSGDQAVIFSPDASWDTATATCVSMAHRSIPLGTPVMEKEVDESSRADIVQYLKEFLEEDKHPIYIPAERGCSTNVRSLFSYSVHFYSGNDLIEKVFPYEAHWMGLFLTHADILKERFSGISPLYNKNSGLLGSDLTKIRTRIEKIMKGGVFSKLYLSQGNREAMFILQDMVVTAVDSKPVFRVIEYPESGLFPLSQKSLLEVIALVADRTGSQMIITTHSPYILTAINNLLLAHLVYSKSKDFGDHIAIDPSQFGAFMLKDGKCHSLVSEESMMMEVSELDTASEELAAEFETLLELYSQKMKWHENE